MAPKASAERRRLGASESRSADWKNWGPYLAERAWGTVREDYSATGDAWSYFPHDHARSRAYRWNEDGLGGFSNRHQNVCLAVALWNERDPILKERLFGLSGAEGNHGEDVKEHYYYLDGTPTHSYMKMLYKYPQVEYPYGRLVDENRRRGLGDPEFELVDAIGDALSRGLYFDVFIEYAKADPEDILCRITAVNRSREEATLHVLPHVWFRNTWSWGYERPRPWLENRSAGQRATVRLSEPHLGERSWYVEAPGTTSAAEVLVTDNETNVERVFGAVNRHSYSKDGIHDAVVDGRADRVATSGRGTKAAARVRARVAPGGSLVVRVRLTPRETAAPFLGFDRVLAARIREADRFYDELHQPGQSADLRRIQRQACAGLLWSKQFYHYGVELWLDGDPAGPQPPVVRRRGRNSDWTHLYNLDVVSMPDKWEYPWFAAWDLAFHVIPLAFLDPEWAKRQLVLLTREWYMHPNGQLPAYEWALGDVNPPVHAWAAWRVYKITRNVTGRADTEFLERVFHKLLLNFTWWVNRKDAEGHNIFQGGFLGLDNIGVFDRSAPLPTGGRLEQSDGTAWMAMYCLNMLAIALELARSRPAYEDVATKFFEHFLYIAAAIHGTDERPGLWNERDGFFYDVLSLPGGAHQPIEIRSFVGLTPLFAVETLEPDLLERLPRFRRRMEWFLRYRPNLVRRVASLGTPGQGGRRLLSLVGRPQLERILERMLDPQQFLSDFGLRSLSREHRDRPYELEFAGTTHRVAYEPGESSGRMFGGNSNWRGPIWFPVNVLMVESLQKFHHYYGSGLRVACPGDSRRRMTLDEVATDLSRRLIRIFAQDADGRRPFHGAVELFQTDPHFRDLVLFHEYFHGDTGAGLGASHQTGWTALVAKLIHQSGRASIRLR